MLNRASIMYCHQRKGRLVRFQRDFDTAHEYDLSQDVYTVIVGEDDRPAQDDRYWGWWDNEEKAFTVVCLHKDLLKSRFPYDLAEEEAQGRGEALPVDMTKVNCMIFDEAHIKFMQWLFSDSEGVDNVQDTISE